MNNKPKILSESMKKLREKLKDSTIFINVMDKNRNVEKNLYKILNDIDYFKIKQNSNNFGYFVNIDSGYQDRTSDFCGKKYIDIIIENIYIHFKNNFYTFDGEILEKCKPESIDIEKYMIDVGKTKNMWLKRMLYKNLKNDVPPEDKLVSEACFDYEESGDKIKIKFKSQSNEDTWSN